MTKKNIIKLSLAASYIFAAFIAGCFPKDSLQWSKDGSTGIYNKNGALFIVNGNTGSLTQVAPKETTTNWPAISSDGAMIAFGSIVKVDQFNNTLKQLPPNEGKLIETHAEILKQKILAEGIKDGNFPFIGKPVATDKGPKDSFNDQHIAWVQRYLVEKADKQLAEKIGPDLISKTKSKDLTYCRLVCAPTSDPNNHKILATSEQTLWRIRFSPNCRLIAFGQDRIYGSAWDVGFDLYIVSLTESFTPAFIAPAVAFGYDFKSDSRAIAYIKPENEFFDAKKILSARSSSGPSSTPMAGSLFQPKISMATTLQKCTSAQAKRRNWRASCITHGCAPLMPLKTASSSPPQKCRCLPVNSTTKSKAYSAAICSPMPSAKFASRPR